MSDEPKPDTPVINGKHDVLTHRLVVLCLGMFVVLSGINITLLQVLDKAIPEPLPALCGTALGALTGMVAAMMRGK